jgi:hypothetical protein
MKHIKLLFFLTCFLYHAAGFAHNKKPSLESDLAKAIYTIQCKHILPACAQKPSVQEWQKYATHYTQCNFTTFFLIGLLIEIFGDESAQKRHKKHCQECHTFYEVYEKLQKTYGSNR